MHLARITYSHKIVCILKTQLYSVNLNISVGSNIIIFVEIKYDFEINELKFKLCYF